MTATTADDHDDRAVAWLQRDDGSWWAVDEFGIAWPVEAFALTRTDVDVQAALGTIGDPIDVAPLSVFDTEADW